MLRRNQYSVETHVAKFHVSRLWVLCTRGQTPGLSGSLEPAATWALSAAVDLKEKCLTSEPRQSCLPSSGSGCGVPPSAAGWLPSPYSSRICQGVVPTRSQCHHLLPIMLWQAADWPRCSSVNHSKTRKGSRRLERKQRFGRGFDWVTAAVRALPFTDYVIWLQLVWVANSSPV